MSQDPSQPLFQIGNLFATPNAISQVTNDEIQAALARHQKGDWGEVCKEDLLANNVAVVNETRILSAYKTSKGKKFWIITEADRSSTTVLMPEDY